MKDPIQGQFKGEWTSWEVARSGVNVVVSRLARIMLSLSKLVRDLQHGQLRYLEAHGIREIFVTGLITYFYSRCSRRDRT